MKNTGSRFLVFAAAMHMGVALAGDVVTEQYTTSAALEAMENAKSQYEADMAQVKLYKQRIAEEQQQFTIAKQKAAASKKRYLEAKANYDKKQTALERAWKK